MDKLFMLCLNYFLKSFLNVVASLESWFSSTVQCTQIKLNLEGVAIFFEYIGLTSGEEMCVEL